MIGIPLDSLALLLSAAALGYVGHVFLKIAEIRETSDGSMTLSRYLVAHPYRTASKAVAVVGALAALAEPVVTPMAFAGAIGMGYMADSAPNHLQKRAGL